MDWLWAATCAGCGAVGADRLCPSCRAHDLARAPVPIPGVTGLWVLARYDSGLGAAVRAAKQRADRGLAVALGRLVARRSARHVRAHFTAVVPAPSTPRALLRRGFSAAAVLAREVAAASGVPVHHALRLTGGHQQARLGANARRANLRGRVRARAAVHGRVLLVDDVVTTGATAAACAAALRAAGADDVWLLTPCVALLAPSDDDAW